MDVPERPHLLLTKKPPPWPILLFLFLTLFLLFLHPSSTPNPNPNPNPNLNLNPNPNSITCAGFYRPRGPPRKAVGSIVDFGGVGDGATSQLNVPRGAWLTGSFNLTSNFTLFLEKGAVIFGSQDPEEWPLIEPLPSYGRGRERLGARHVSLIHGNGLTDVVITGNNGSIDGQGRMWWELWWNKTLNNTRGHLVELVNSTNILISNITLLNSPFWTIHPVYCSNVVIRNLTILAPLNSPNTDGIDPDSSSQVCIEDCYIESGDDLVAVKSGWDQYGMAVARPSTDIIIQRISGTTPTCSGVGFGSEMSGGISNILVNDLRVWNSASAVRFKTDKGRGGYVTNVTITNVAMENVKIPVRFSRGSNDHPDENYDPNALPRISNLYVGNVVGSNIARSPVLEGIKGTIYEGLCFRNVSFEGVNMKKKWQCEFVRGEAYDVSPMPCEQLLSNGSSSSSCRNK
ncbi:probable polygalacturonase [Ananas comosus]|uniref:Probable polygalacturonase n=1 Tax=Ananas comosus TaxID=4615 RepID=A0A6P5F4W6_ANACO|nr:probable polygalacturonase [Ananas comosus]